MSKVSEYLVLDIETEGLDPTKHSILEVGAIAVGSKLEEVAHFDECAIGATPRAELSEFIRNMHTKSGLLDEIERCIDGGVAQTESDLDACLATWILAQGYTPGKVVLAGNSVHFDSGFLRARMPKTAALLHYRIFDIGALGRELTACGLRDAHADWEVPHRGLPDASLELDHWRKLRRLIGGL